MVVRNAEATRARILDAAKAEFAKHGLAGGRVERIAREARTNIRMVYAYFESKERLFAAAVVASIKAMAEAVPPTPEDLPGWAGRLFDFHASDPIAMRINQWAQLERPEAASEPMGNYLAKTALVESASQPPITVVDLLTFIYAVSQAWYLTPTGLLSSDGSDPKDVARLAVHRAALMAAVARMTEADRAGEQK